MKTNLTIRAAVESDWRAVKTLLEENGLPLDGVRERLDSYLLVIDDGQVVGCAGTEAYGDIALLRSVAVARQLQGRGVGRTLVSRLLEDVRQQKRSRVYLVTVTAAQYFAKFGFKPVPVEETPQALRASAVFHGACPDSATLMLLTLQA